MIGVVATQLPPLADMVRRKHDEEHVSYREMADNSRRAGHFISHSQLAAYAADGVRKAPSSEQMVALASALGVSYEKVRAAMIEQYFGYVPRDLIETHGTTVTAAVPPDLTEAEERELRRLVEAWVAARHHD